MGLFSDLRMKGRKVVAEPDGIVLFKGAVLMAVGITAVSTVLTEFDPAPKMIFVIVGLVCAVFGVRFVLQYIKDYKAFKAFVPVWDTGRGIYDKFAIELNNWQQGGQVPKCCDGDTAYYLKLQRERLRKKGIQMQDSIMPVKGTGFGTATLSRKSAWYTTDMTYENIHRKMAFVGARGTLYEREVDQVMYEIIAHTPNDAQTENITVTCPNCGSLSPVSELEEGCRYCDTRFKITDLFPRVVNLYFLKSYSIANTKLILQNTMVATMLGIFLVFVLVGIVKTQTPGEIPGYLASTFFASLILGGFLGYILGGFRMIAVQFDRDGQKRISAFKWARTKSKITNTLNKYDPAFSYDKFEGQLVSLIRMAVFAEQPEELACYRGGERDARFADILEMTYTNGTVLNKVRQDGNKLQLSLRTWWVNYSEENGQVKKTGDCIDVVVSRDMTRQEAPGFSITSVQCESCGGSFDAVRQRKCPYCGSEYHMEKEGWVIEDMKLVR